MDFEVVGVIYDRAEEFGAIARKVSEESRSRKEHCESAMGLTGRFGSLCDTLCSDIQRFYDASVAQRDKNAVILNSCSVIQSNLKKQEELIAGLSGSGGGPAGTADRIRGVVGAVLDHVEEALGFIRQIIDLDNRMILQTRLILHSKLKQVRAIRDLEELMNASLEDSMTAINGAKANLGRGLDMVQQLKGTGDLVENKMRADIERLREEARTGWQTAERVNASSVSQFEFAGQVRRFSRSMSEQAERIRAMVSVKHEYFELSVQLLTSLTVTLSMKFLEYREAVDLFASIGSAGDADQVLYELAPYVEIAWMDISVLSAHNLDMIGSSRRINEIDAKIIATTREETALGEEIWSRVEAMTDASRYPVDGSARNIENGKFIEKRLGEILAKI